MKPAMTCLITFMTFVFLLGSTLAGNELLAEDLVIKFNREVWLKVVPPCVLDSRGSMLTVYPQNIPFDKFIRLVAWDQGIPGYLVGTKDTSVSFDFDLTRRITIKGEMVLRIIRTTTRVSTNGIVIVAKGSNPPVILKQLGGERKH